MNEKQAFNVAMWCF